MEQQQIFENLNLPEQVAKELANYWKVAGDNIGIINHRGALHTQAGVWKRPMGSNVFQELKKALQTNRVRWIVVADTLISIDFGMLRYNEKYVKQMICDQQMGVKDSEDGLKMFKKQMVFGTPFYQEQTQSLKGVTVESLGLKHSEVVSISPISENPDFAEWAELYFVA